MESKTSVELSIITCHGDKEGNSFQKLMDLNFKDYNSNSNAKQALMHLYEGIELKNKKLLEEAKEFIDELIREL